MSDKAIMFVHALTGLHPGGGTALGVVDLPVQRERHTDWPIIAGSSLKGVLRAECNTRSNDQHDQDLDVLAAFGPATMADLDYAGALAVTDARILAFPVRSLMGVFAWITCPAVLERFSRDCGIIGGSQMSHIPKPEKDKAICSANSPLLVTEDKIILEEFEFSVVHDDTNLEMLSQAIADKNTRERFQDHLVVLHDDDFTYFVRNATGVVARIGLDYEQKSVRKGALFYEEYLPAETLLYALVLCSQSRRKGYKRSPDQILRWLKDQEIAFLQIGAGETIGKGFCAIHIALPETEFIS